MGAAAGGIIGGLGNLGSGIAQGEAMKESAAKQEAASRYGTDINKQLSEAALKWEKQKYPAEFNLQRQAQEQAFQNLINQYGMQSEQSEALRKAYQQQQGQYGAGEENLSKLFMQTPEALEQLKGSILSGQAKQLQQGQSALNAALAQQGVRGAQAAAQQRRAIGETTEAASESIQNLIAQEALNRAAQQRQYEMGKQGNIQKFLQQQAAYSQPAQIDSQARMQAMQDAFNKYNTAPIDALALDKQETEELKKLEELKKKKGGGGSPNVFDQIGTALDPSQWSVKNTFLDTSKWGW